MSRQELSPFLPEDTLCDPQDARRSNRGRVMRSIITRGPASRAELARRTGLSRPTVSVIVNELMTTGVLMEGERVSSGGAPGTLLEIAKDTGVTVAADLRVPGRIRMAAVSVSGEILQSRTAVATTRQALATALIGFSQNVAPTATLGVALGVPGWVNPAGEWLDAHTPEVDPALLLELRKKLRTPVFALNSTDAIAVADLRGSPPGLAAQASISMDSRVSAGLVIGGRLRTGLRRPAGDIAHVVPGPPGPVCPWCGRSCLQAHVMPLTTDYSPMSRRRAAEALGTVMAPIAAAVELGEVVLAGFPGEIAAALAHEMAMHMGTRMLEEQVPTVRVSSCGKDGVVLGAAAMMLYRRLA